MESQPYECNLSQNDIKQPTTRVSRRQSNAFVASFNRTVLERSSGGDSTTFFESREAVRNDVERWLAYHNAEWLHQGDRNRCRRPIETAELYLKGAAEAAEEYNSLRCYLTDTLWCGAINIGKSSPLSSSNMKGVLPPDCATSSRFRSPRSYTTQFLAELRSLPL
jgi:hypothetical protein